MTDLKARLRREVPYQGKSRPAFLCHEAADRIEQLEAELHQATNEINAMKDALAQCQCN